MVETGSGDRRGGGRQSVDPACGITLSFRSGALTASGEVVEVAEGGITVRIQNASLFTAGSFDVESALLRMPDGREVPLEGLTLGRLEADRGTFQATFTTADPGARAVLWHFMLRLRAGHGHLSPSDASPPPVLPRIPDRLRHTEEARLKRLAWIRQQTGALLAPLETTRLDASRLSANIENLIGAVEIPVGVAGPLFFRGEHVQGLAYLPMATTEGALVASTCRGALAITRSGGVTTRVLGQRMLRAPLFVCGDLESAWVVAEWIRDHLSQLRQQVRHVSAHAHLVSVTPYIMGRNVHVLFAYETGDAAGQIMTTACTFKACQWLLGEVRRLPDVTVEDFIIEANMSGDKKLSFASFIGGRGLRVVAEARISDAVLRQIMDVTAEKVLRLHTAAVAGALQAGTIGYNINLANVVAAVFAATGQDIACVHESGTGVFGIHPDPEGLRISLVLPSLVVGTVGGGTHLPAQRALLEMIDCAGRGRVRRFGELIAGFCLALELSTACAVAGGQFAEAHDRLGRNRPVPFFAREDFTPGLLEPGLRRLLDDPSLNVTSIEVGQASLGASILSRFTVNRLKKLVGLFPVRVTVSGRRRSGEVHLLAKLKPLGEESLLVMDGMALMSGGRVSAAWRRFRTRTEFADTHTRELGACRQEDPRFRRHVPGIVALVEDPRREAYVVIMERLSDVELLDTANDPSGWKTYHVAAALTGLAALHSIWLGREQELLTAPWLGPVRSTPDTKEMAELWDALAVHAGAELPDLVGPEQLELHRAVVRSVGEWWPRLELLPRTLIHNDFNPRNVALRNTAEGPRLVAYDWELCTLHVPQRDLAEFLAFVLSESATEADVAHLIELHRSALEQASGVHLDPEAWREGYALSLLDFLITRMGFYLMGHTFGEYRFVERVYRTLLHLIAIERDRGTLRNVPATE